MRHLSQNPTIEESWEGTKTQVFPIVSEGHLFDEGDDSLEE